jgi:hypothetical protein
MGQSRRKTAYPPLMIGSTATATRKFHKSMFSRNGNINPILLSEIGHLFTQPTSSGSIFDFCGKDSLANPVTLI